MWFVGFRNGVFSYKVDGEIICDLLSIDAWVLGNVRKMFDRF